LGGIIIIVVAGLAMTALNRRYLRTSEGERDERELQATVLDQEQQIRRNEMDLAREEARKSLLEAGKEELALHEKLVAGLESEIATLADLGLAVPDEEAFLRELEEKQAAYRSRFRAGHWPKFVNMELKVEHLQRELPYQDMKVLKVDAAGLMVRHRSGVARVEVEELDPGFRHDLDLSVDEAKAVMTEMLIQDARTKQARVRRANQSHAPSEAEIEAIINQRSLAGRAKVLEYLKLLQRAEKTAEIARHNDKYSSNRSAPGRLETWAERAKRFEKAEVQYRKLLTEAVSEVRKYEPDFEAPRE
jgi:phosphoribosyl-AMP cyclohydrolase